MVTPILKSLIEIREMKHEDLSKVLDIERRSYDFPWSHGVFRDCQLSGYYCVVLCRNKSIVGYAVLSIAASEANILNLCIDPDFRSLGYGGSLLDKLLHSARSASVREVFLEVRPTNEIAISLYHKKGFYQIADRKAYYQANNGRENALVLAKKLSIDY